MAAPLRRRIPVPIPQPALFREQMRACVFSFLLFVTSAEYCLAQPIGDNARLDFDNPVSVLLLPGKAEILRLNPQRAEAEEVFLDTAARDVSFRIVSSNGAKIQSGRLSTYGWATIPLALAEKSEIQLELTLEDAVEGLPGIRVRAERFPIPQGTLSAHMRAARAFSSAQLLHRSLQAEDVRKAIIQFQQAADEWSRCGELYGAALALGGEAESQIDLSRYQEAMSTVKNALGLDAHSAYVRGWLNHLAARVYLDQWEPKPAREFAQETLRLGKKIGDPALIALGHTDLVGVDFWNFDADANEIDEQAHAEAIAAGLPEILGLERQWKAWLEENDGHVARAATLMSEAESYFRHSGDLRTDVEVTGQVAEVAHFSGDLSSALLRMLELEHITKAMGNSLYYGILTENIGQIYFGLGKFRFAAVYYQLAERAFASAHFQRGLMDIYGDLCESEVSSGAIWNAVADCRASLALARKTQEPVFIGNAEYELGLADRKAGKITEAFADFAEAARNSHVRTDLLFESKERIQLGELLEESGKQNQALDQFLTAERLVQNAADPASLLEAQYSVARWYAHHGQHTKAHAELESAIDKLEAARQMVSDSVLQATYFATERKCYELAIELRMREFERDPAGGGDALALELSEQSRARGLLDAQAAKTSGDKHGDAEASLLRSNIAVDRAFDRRLKLLVSGGAKRDLQASASELTQTLGDLERANDAANPAAGEALKTAATMSVTALEGAALGSAVTFFEYMLGDQHSYLWLIGAGIRKSFVLPPRAELEGMAKQWRASATSQDRGRADASRKFQLLSARLSCALFANAVEAHMKRIVIVPDGGLAMLPFAALPENGCSRVTGEPLVVGHEITQTPSLSIFFSHKPTPQNKAFQGEIAIVADPVFDAADPRAATLKAREPKDGSHTAGIQDNPVALPRLLNTGYEAMAIQETVRRTVGKHQVFLARGFDASVETILSPAMQKYRIWHLATHGVYDETMPEFSGLVFSTVGPDGNPRFGLLKAHDIARLNVPAELVVLSACDSAAGENVNGEGVLGLSYAFLHAGAKQVISTLWSVDDDKSRDLMVAFYRELMSNGGNAAAALRQGQLLIMRQPHGSDPYYWAGFELTSLGE
jgi:CHAT domain-containing protein